MARTRTPRVPEVLSPMPADRRWSADERAELARRVAAGESSSTIAAALGRSLRSVENARAYTPKPRRAAMVPLTGRVPAALDTAINAYGERAGLDRAGAVRAVLSAGLEALAAG